MTESFASFPALGKAQKEVAEYHRFRELSHQLVQVNDKDLSAATGTRGADGISFVADKKRGRRSTRKSVKK